MNISQSAKDTAAKLPPDVLMHPMPLPDRIAYAEKIIQEAIEESQRERDAAVDVIDLMSGEFRRFIDEVKALGFSVEDMEQMHQRCRAEIKHVAPVIDQLALLKLKYAAVNRRSKHTHSAIAAIIAFSGATAALSLNPASPMPFHYSAILGLALGLVAYAWIRDTWREPCSHRNVTVTEDGGRCTDCRRDVSYSTETRNWE